MPRPESDEFEDELEDEEEDDEDEDDEEEEAEEEEDEDEDGDDELEDFVENLEQAVLNGLEDMDELDNRGTTLRVKMIDGTVFVVSVRQE